MIIEEKMSKLKYDDKIIEMIKGLYNLYDEQCSDILLYGSTSIGKFSYSISDNVIDCYSDIEFIVIPKDKNNENNKVFRKQLMDKSYQYLKKLDYIRKAPFVDVNPVSLDFFFNAQIRISTFELKNNGMCLKGDELLNYLPQICPQNYQPTIQNIEIVKGLKILLLESYEFFINSDRTSNYDEERYHYFLSSSYLNVLRTLLPLFDEFQLCTEDRVNAFLKLKENDKICKYFSEDVIEGFELVAHKKEKYDFVYNSEELLQLTYNAYKSLLCLLLECEEKDLIKNIEKKNEVIFYGDDEKKEMLSNLTCYFIAGIESLIELIKNSKLSIEKLNMVRNYYDKLLYGNNAFEFKQIVEDYVGMEKKRWKIIGSKD